MRTLSIDAHLRVPNLSDVPGVAQSAERVGFDGLWSSEGKYDAYLQIAAAAPATRELALGTSVALAFPRSPMSAAHIAWDLQRGSHGRFTLGLGPQVRAHNERRYSVPGDRPQARLIEHVQAVRAIWEHWQSGAQLAFEGQFYSISLDLPFMDPGPLECPPPPIVLGAVGPLMCRAVGIAANGISIHPLHSIRYIKDRIIPNIEGGAAKAGRADRPYSIVAMVFVGSGRSAAEIADAREEIRRTIAFYSSTKAYRPVLELHGWQEIADRLRAMAREGRWDDMASLVTDEMVESFALIGEPDEVLGCVRARYAGTVDRVIVYEPYALAAEDLWARALAAAR